MFFPLIFLLVLAGLNLRLRADVVETVSGARLTGQITEIDAGKISLKTDYAGMLVIKQSKVTSVTTDGAVNIHLKSGAAFQGRLARAPDGTLVIQDAGGEIRTRMDLIMSVAPLAEEAAVGGAVPAAAMTKPVAVPKHKWSYQAGMDFTGKSGNATSAGIATNFLATLKGRKDTLKLYGEYNYTKSGGVKSVDESKMGADYANDFYDGLGWFTRSELQQDKIAAVNLRSTTDFGLTYTLIKNLRDTLTVRLGSGYQYQSFSDGIVQSSVLLSSGLSNSYKFSGDALLTTDIQYLPVATHLGDFRFVHDSGLELPLTASLWKLRVGVTNEYTSRPQSGRKNMDTTYYTRLLLIWK